MGKQGNNTKNKSNTSGGYMKKSCFNMNPIAEYVNKRNKSLAIKEFIKEFILCVIVVVIIAVIIDWLI
jgi:hypothetical protein